MWRAFDLGYLSMDSSIATPEGKRAAVLLTLAGLLEFPADQNFVDGLWAMALETLSFPDISRSVVRACITDEDHNASNYYGSRRGVRHFLDSLSKTDPVAFEKLRNPDSSIGRARPIVPDSSIGRARPTVPDSSPHDVVSVLRVESPSPASG
jgi:hypothetical protein